MTRLEDLDIFAQVARSLSMSAAGRELGLSPAVVSKRIKHLEERLGTRLFQRTTRQLSLTESGQGFLIRIEAILAGIEDAEAFIAGRTEEARGTLKISAPTSFGRMHVAPHLKPFMQANPGITINLTLSDEFIDLVAGGYDLAIRIGELTDSSLVARRLAPVRRLLCASPDYVTAHGMPETLSDLDRHICLPPHNNDTWRLEGPDGPVIYRPQGPLVTNSSEVIREAVIAGLGIALRSTWDVGPELKSGKLVPVLPFLEAPKNVALSAVYRRHARAPVGACTAIEGPQGGALCPPPFAGVDNDRRRGKGLGLGFRSFRSIRIIAFLFLSSLDFFPRTDINTRVLALIPLLGFSLGSPRFRSSQVVLSGG